MDEQNNIPKEFTLQEYQAELVLPEDDSDIQPSSSMEPSVSTAKPKKSKKPNGCLRNIIWMICILLVSVGLASTVIVCFSDYAGMGKDFIRMQETQKVHIYVEEGASVREIASQLKEKDVLMSRLFFLTYLKLTGKGGNFSYGAHDFETDMGYGEILQSLTKPAKGEDVTVTIPSGKRVEEILHILEDAGVCSYADLRDELLNGTFESELWNEIPKHPAMVYPMEGYLFPDTYNFYLNDDPHRVIQKMLDNLEEKFTPAMRQAGKDRGYTPHQILTMASMVETESCGYLEEMPRVSAVFYNRLNDTSQTVGLLQSDPTMEYPYGDGAYDTYKIKGLPPGPISTVSEAALWAAVSPDATVTAHYFVTDVNARFYYSDTLSQHEAVITALKDNGLWLADLQNE